MSAEFEPATEQQEIWLRALHRQNLARRRALLQAVHADAALRMVASLREALPSNDDVAARLLAELCEQEADALRQRARARAVFRWAAARTLRTLVALGSSR